VVIIYWNGGMMEQWNNGLVQNLPDNFSPIIPLFQLQTEEVIQNNMAVSMRLMRFGGKKSPFYRIVVSDRRSSRDGRFIDQVGTYDPKKNPGEVRFKEEKTIQWLRKGAQPTPTVRQLLKSSGVSKKLKEGNQG
jgi:small subunit ribosomal protein S16